jgi:phospholipid/cholesterol/gamma-HCH transport system substrate-binding protein
LGAEQAAKLCVQYLAPIVKNRQYNWPPLGFDLFVGAQARPNEVTYSEDWMRPDYVPPAVPPAVPPGPNPTAPASPFQAPPLAAEAPAPLAPLAAEAPPPATVSTDPAAGLPGMMVPSGGG